MSFQKEYEDYLVHSGAITEEELQHYGVPGMRWGVRKVRNISGASYGKTKRKLNLNNKTVARLKQAQSRNRAAAAKVSKGGIIANRLAKRNAKLQKYIDAGQANIKELSKHASSSGYKYNSAKGYANSQTINKLFGANTIIRGAGGATVDKSQNGGLKSNLIAEYTRLKKKK